MPNACVSCAWDGRARVRLFADFSLARFAKSDTSRSRSAMRSQNPGSVINPIARAAALVVSPQRTWNVIARERPSFAELLFGYVVPLAAIGPIATYVALRVLGVAVSARAVYRSSQPVALASAGQSFAFALGGVFLVAALITAFAPAFGGKRDFARSFQLAAYAYTPLWLAGVFLLVPRIASLQLVAAGDALVLLVLGIVALVGTSAKRATIFAGVVVAAAFGCGYLVGVAAAVVRGPIE